MAICIIPNLLRMFNENRTFFVKNLLDAGFWMLDTRKKFYRRGRGFIATKRHKRQKYKIRQDNRIFLPKRSAFVHKAIEMALFKSWLKRCFFSREKEKNAQKITKNGQKSA